MGPFQGNAIIRLEELTDVLDSRAARCGDVWDALWRCESIGRIAVCVGPSEHDLAQARDAMAAIDLRVPHEEPSAWTPEWESALRENLARLLAQARAPGDGCPLLGVPRFVHAQSQGICDIFGARIEEMADGNVFVHPLDITPDAAATLTPQPVEASRYHNAVEWIRCARSATDGRVPFRMPVMTGPLDTASYLLGPERLLEWIHAEPEALHAFLDTVAEVLQGMIRLLQEAAGGVIHSHHFSCTRGGFDLCSEVRSLISQEAYETFESPRLRRLGEALGPYGIHSCGSWERTVPSALAETDCFRSPPTYRYR